MDKTEALKEIQRMHADKIVRRESIIAWYKFYSNKLPRMHPERSIVELIQTIDLWMDLTDKGGQPGFPFQYQSELELPDPSQIKPKGSPLWLLGTIVLIVSLPLIYFHWKSAVIIALLGFFINLAGYHKAGGQKNVDLLSPDTTLYKKYAKRVYDWSNKMSSEQDKV